MAQVTWAILACLILFPPPAQTFEMNYPVVAQGQVAATCSRSSQDVDFVPHDDGSLGRALLLCAVIFAAGCITGALVVWAWPRRCCKRNGQAPLPPPPLPPPAPTPSTSRATQLDWDWDAYEAQLAWRGT